MKKRPLQPDAGVRQGGLSLIEIMVALVIAALLLLGLSQIFIGSKSTYRLQEGMSRVQENARFVLQYLEENVRMAGYMGCGNDVDLTTKPGTPPSFLNHLRRLDSALGVVPIRQETLLPPERFERPIEGFAAVGSGDGAQPAVGDPAVDWVPAIPGGPNGYKIDAPVKGSDILILRIISDESTPLLGDFDMGGGKFNVGKPDFVVPGKVYAITNCANARIFKASTRTPGSNPVIAGAADNLLFLTTDTGSTWTGTFANLQFNQSGSTLNAEVHRADYLALYVGLSADNSEPVLKVVDGQGVSEELADNVESMRIQYGTDTDGDGAVDKYFGADSTDAAANLADMDNTNRDANWRKVLSVRVALLMRSQDRASVGTHGTDNTYDLFDVPMTRPVDGRFRDVYTTTIALRNRLSNY
jgi:type IV pilus assembly protein PilW